MLVKQNHIVVRVDLEQKKKFKIGDAEIFTGRGYNENFRERNPVVAEIVDGFGDLQPGKLIICHYNHFDDTSLYQLYDNLFAIPNDEMILAIIQEDGSLSSVNDNIICERIDRFTAFPLPPELKKQYHDRGIVSHTGYGFEKGDLVFFYPFSDYEICFTWNNLERRYVKVEKSEIVGVLHKKHYVK
jgi:hypothetical protein